MHQEIARLKKRRDALLHRACTRQERPAIMKEVRAINRRLAELEHRLGARRPKRDH